MADILNLRKARKAKARKAAEDAANLNRVAYGANSSEKRLMKAQNTLATKKLDGAKRNPKQ